MTYPEADLLAILVGDSAARKVSAAPGGWRTLSEAELEKLRLRRRAKDAVIALQALTSRPFAELPAGKLCDAPSVAAFYTERLGSLDHEVVIAVALDGQNRALGEFEVARGGRHGAALTAADVFRPVIRAGASALILLHNHPSGDPSPSSEDIHLTKALRNAGIIVGVPLLDHIIVAARRRPRLLVRARRTGDVVNARVPAPSAADRGGSRALATAAAELLAAGEGLVRAAGALAELARKGARSPPTSNETRPRSSLPVGERLSSKQLGAIRAISRRAGLSRDGLVDLLDEITGKEEPSDLSRSEASLVLDKLSALTGYAR